MNQFIELTIADKKTGEEEGKALFNVRNIVTIYEEEKTVFIAVRCTYPGKGNGIVGYNVAESYEEISALLNGKA